eukprot:COSAG02_NODE_7403_length_3033_cov_3.831970_2_plen_80_part_00
MEPRGAAQQRGSGLQAGRTIQADDDHAQARRNVCKCMSHEWRMVWDGLSNSPKCGGRTGGTNSHLPAQIGVLVIAKLQD